jgi:hypothetical protein
MCRQGNVQNARTSMVTTCMRQRTEHEYYKHGHARCEIRVLSHIYTIKATSTGSAMRSAAETVHMLLRFHKLCIKVLTGFRHGACISSRGRTESADSLDICKQTDERTDRHTYIHAHYKTRGNAAQVTVSPKSLLENFSHFPAHDRSETDRRRVRFAGSPLGAYSASD